MDGTPLLEARAITKSFGGARALSGAHLSVLPGEVHALLGANGAGKSTLIKVINGLHRPDSGELLWDGSPLVVKTLADARGVGIATMFQHLNVPGDLTVAEYLTLGRESALATVIRPARNRSLAESSLSELGIELELSRLCNTLSVAEKELMEISRAVSQKARLVIMDEPTASLGAEEVDRLFSVVNRLRARGVAIVYVSHKLEEVLAITDRSTVLRDGATVGTVATAGCDEATLLAMMVGKYAPIEGVPTARPVQAREVLTLRDVSTSTGISNASFALHEGEILGVYGLMGAGRTELLRAIYGVDRITVGQLEVDGAPVVLRSPAHARKLGMGLVPEDRIREALIPDYSVSANLTLAAPGTTTRYGWFSRSRERQRGESAIADIGIKAPAPDASIMTLSGGNQQKVVLGRWIVAGTRILLLDDPTVGVDVPAKHEIYRQIRSLAASGVSVILCSSELSEILHLADRIIVMHRKRVVAQVARAATDANKLERLSILGHSDTDLVESS